jgi:hypothetical protein
MSQLMRYRSPHGVACCAMILRCDSRSWSENLREVAGKVGSRPVSYAFESCVGAAFPADLE